MRRMLALLIVCVAFAPPLLADDAISPATVETVKKATTYIRVAFDDGGASGSGFVVKVTGETALIATNHHVAASPGHAGKTGKIAVVFDSGMKTERTAAGEVVAMDKEHDLAILRVTGVKNLPAPLPYTPPKLTELMPVYTFGFPFGAALSSSKGSPAVTVGKASISSLRLDDAGELALVQIDGALNPGNSGGPVVDASGRVVGVAVATIRDSSGIGLIVPGAELMKMMNGRLGPVRVTTNKRPDGKVTVRAEADLIDPVGNVRRAAVHYLHVAPGAAKPTGDALDKLPGTKKLDLKVEKGVASAEFVAEREHGDVLFQAVTQNGDGVSRTDGALQTVSLAPPAVAVNGGLKPPVGWKEHTIKDHSFVVWVPEIGAPVSERERTSIVRGQRLKVSVLAVPLPGNVLARAELLQLPLTFIRAPRKDLIDLLRTMVLETNRGTLIAERPVQFGPAGGTEYVVRSGATLTRTRVFVLGARVYLAEASGPTDAVERGAGAVFLASFRLPGVPNVVEVPAPAIVASNKAELARFDGVWKITSFETDGVKMPEEEVKTKSRLVFKGGHFWYEGGTTRGTISMIDPSRTPATLDYTYTAGAQKGQTQPAVYALDGTTLTDCFPTTGGARPTELATKSGSGLTLIRYVRVGPPPAESPGQEVRPVVPPAPGSNRDDQVKSIGLPFGTAFAEPAPAGSVLVGFEVGLGTTANSDVVKAVRAIYRAGGKESFGEQRGTPTDRQVTVKARDGYAVAALTGKSRREVDGFSLKFVKLVDGKPNPRDTYESEWVGGTQGKGAATTIGSADVPIVGCGGRVVNDGKSIGAIGLMFPLGATPGNPVVRKPGEGPKLLGFSLGDRFEDFAPAGGLLIGFELGLSKFFNNDIITAYRPIYRTGDKESFGEQHGSAGGATVTVRAKAGYAVGALSAKTGLGIDGISVTFMKVADGKLDATDTYESEWVGGLGGGGKTKVGGNGTPLVGITGVLNREKNPCAIGVLTPADRK